MWNENHLIGYAYSCGMSRVMFTPATIDGVAMKNPAQALVIVDSNYGARLCHSYFLAWIVGFPP